MPWRNVFGDKRLVKCGWAMLGSPISAEMLASLPFDAVCIDLQHGADDASTASAGATGLLRALSSRAESGLVPLCRMASGDPAEIGRVLDAGALGAIVPSVESADDAARLVAACRYPPLGQRSYGPLRAQTLRRVATMEASFSVGGGSSTAFACDYLATANGRVVAVALVETKRGLEAVEDIAAVPGLDGILIGPFDLGLDLGAAAPGDVAGDPDLRDAAERVLAAAHSAGIRAGVYCRDGATAAVMAARGFDLVIPGNDSAYLMEGAERALRAIGGHEPPGR